MVSASQAYRPVETGSKLLLAGLLCLCCALPNISRADHDRLPGAFGEAFPAIEQAPRSQARIYAYRPHSSAGAQAIHLFIDGRYHTSLLSGGYTQFCTSSNQWNLQSSAAFETPIQDPGQMVSTRAGQVLILRVDGHDQAGTHVTVISADQALGELRQTRLQQHTLSRAVIAEKCDHDLFAPPTAEPRQTRPVKSITPAARTDTYTLQGDALFDFKKSSLSASGMRSLEDLIQKMRRDFVHIERVRVIGHSDAIGPTKLNQTLSLERAKSVAAHLQHRALKPVHGILTEGRGATEPIQHGCNTSPTPTNKTCHAPNRRVVIMVYGLHR